MSDIKTSDKTVLKSLGFCASATVANLCAVDVKDGRIARVRPLHYDTLYSREDLNYWTIKVGDHAFEPLMKSFPPPLSLAYKQRAYSSNRVPYPLKRIDWDPGGERNPQNRGKSKFIRISWDEALDLIAQEIKRVHDTYGPYSILAQYDGHGETKCLHPAHGAQVPLLDLMGGCTQQVRQPDSWEGWYWGAKHVWGMDPVGENIWQSNLVKDIAENSDALLYWGCDPETTPWGWGGQMASRICYFFGEIGVERIFICPDVNYAGAVHADKWIPILPNTDAAFQLAIAYVWMTEETYEKEYLEMHAVGYDWFEYYVLGREDGIPKTPEWAAEKCGVPSYRIKAFARYWASHKVSIAHCNGGGYIRSVFSHEPARLEVCLLGMRGLGQPGVNQLKFIEWTLFGMLNFDPLPPGKVLPNFWPAYRGADLIDIGESFITKTKIPEAILEPRQEWYGHTMCAFPTADQFKKFEYPIPGAEPLHLIWSDAPCWETCWNGGNLYQDAMRHESIETIIIQHPWMENACTMADIILPVTTTFENRDFSGDVCSGQFIAINIEDQAIEPIGEARSDYECVLAVARALEGLGGQYEGLVERFTGGMSDEDYMHLGFAESGILSVDPSMTFERLEENGFWMCPADEEWENMPTGLIRFYETPESFPLSTPTGKLEYYSSALAENFPSDTIRGPYPKWIEESDEHQERIGSERAKRYPYLLVSNHPRWRVHANHDDVSWLREIETCKVKGPDGYLYEPLWINPKDAKRLDVKTGDVARLFNERGSVLGGVRVTERIMPGSVYQDHGARVDSIIKGTGGLDRGGANNLIAPSATSSKNAAGEVTNGFLVGVEKVDVLALARQYPEEFGRDYDAGVGLVASIWITEG
jgi:trimethylamine-N-oxide reductase (cytochrome c)